MPIPPTMVRTRAAAPSAFPGDTLLSPSRTRLTATTAVGFTRDSTTYVGGWNWLRALAGSVEDIWRDPTQCVQEASDAGYFFYPDPIGSADHVVYMQVVNLVYQAGNEVNFGPCVRGAPGSTDIYRLERGSTPSNFHLIKNPGGEIRTGILTGVQNGDVIGLRAVGNVIGANINGGAWTEYTDNNSPILTNQYVGMANWSIARLTWAYWAAETI